MATSVINKPILASFDIDITGFGKGLDKGFDKGLDKGFDSGSDTVFDAKSDTDSDGKRDGVSDTAGKWDKVVESFMLAFFIA